MKKLEYTVRFTTPAFLGNAEQAGQWRTPPFKALIRQWWRVVHAPEVNYDVEALRRDEGALFGVAADGGDSRQSLVRFRLSEWAPGSVDSWDRDDRLPHPEVTNREGQVMPIGAQLYLGYGPLTFGDTGRRNQQGRPIKDTVLNTDPKRTAIAAEFGQTLALTVPKGHGEEIEWAIRLAQWFGTLGSRSRNGWGALQIEAKPGTSTPAIPALTRAALSGLSRPLAQCLQLDWPHAIGTDDKAPLVWYTAPRGSWREVMKELARIKIAFRTQESLSLMGVPDGRFARRHLLAYPVTHHAVSGVGWGNQGRLANQLRLKVTKQGNQWLGVLVHLPCRLAAEMVAGLPQQHRQNLDAEGIATWHAVHTVIDQNAHRI
jgi:CRISPR-associated protein Cmr1